ncbi:MAG: YbhB/YbcL family Raf kinase inhibitor-like protein [Wenzhouxiangellaceae bacterium]
MILESRDLRDGQPIDPRFAFGRIDPEQHMRFSDNLSPHLKWDQVPDGTRSFALLCVDPDVPSVADDVNQEGRVVRADLPRVDFFHWAMVDIPAAVRELATGECGRGVHPGGKRNPPGPEGARQGLNDYTSFMAGSDLAGQYFGYDGPCPPWNDERLHHYIFTIHALDVDRLELPEVFDGRDVQRAIEGHVLDQASITGTYTLNPKLAG